MMTARVAPSGLSETESGWPPTSQVAVTCFEARSMTASWPEGLALLSEVTTPTSALPPETVTEVGSPASGMKPAAFGAFGSEMSMRPTASCGESV